MICAFKGTGYIEKVMGKDNITETNNFLDYAEKLFKNFYQDFERKNKKISIN